MKTSLLLTALVVSVSASEDIKEKLQQFRDPANIDQNNVFKYLNDRHEQRINKLEELLEQRQKQLNDHESGHRKLSSEEHARVLRQTNNFERKLNQLKNIEPDELADLMQHEAESIYKLNSVDYLDFEIKN